MGEPEAWVAIFGMLFVLGIVFMVFVAPFWLIMRMREQRRATTQLGAEGQTDIEGLTRAAERMEERIATLEKILDVEVPRWRQTMKDHER